MILFSVTLSCVSLKTNRVIVIGLYDICKIGFELSFRSLCGSNTKVHWTKFDWTSILLSP